jgi:glutathione synthase/RimK-type ligase-like ATP-grasp enzyme
VPALAERGVEAVPAVWDDPAVDWGAHALTVVRTTWDYVARRDAFLAWAQRVPRLANPAEVLAWNTDKRYLAELHAAGLPVVPTTFLAPGQALTAAAMAGGEVVVKPSISVGSLDTDRHADPYAAAAHVAQLHTAGRTAMVQPYVAGVEQTGETALLYVGGSLSHAIRKGPMLTGERATDRGLYVVEEIAPRTPSDAERALGDRVMEHVRERFGALLYARVDLLPGPAGEPLIVEVELTEPSLFLDTDRGAPGRLAEAIARRL